MHSDEELLNDGKEPRRKYSNEFSNGSNESQSEKFKEAIEHIFKTLELLIGKLDGKDGRYTEEVKILFSRIELLQTDLGTRSTSRVDNFEVPTMWGSVAVLAGLINDIKRELSSMPSVESMKNVFQADLDKIEAQTNGTVDLIIMDLQEKVQQYIAQQGTLRSDSRAELDRVKNSVNISQKETDKIILSLTQGAVVLKNELEAVRRLIRNIGTGSAPVTSSSNCSNYVPIPVYNGKMKSVDDELQKLRDKILKVETDADGDAVKAFGLGYKEKRASEEWINTYLNKVPFGLVLDAHLLLKNLYSMTSDNENTIKTLHSMQKLNLSNMTDEALVPANYHY